MATALVTQIAYAVQTLFDPAGTAGRLVDLGKLANYGLLTSFTPAALFTTGVNGAWYDQSDFSTLFQDAAGTLPVTAVGQPVGLMLDKSKGLVLGPELVTNGDFSQGTTGWLTLAGWSISSGQGVATATSGALYQQNVAMATSKWYLVTFDVTVASGAVYVITGSRQGPSRATSGKYSAYLSPSSGSNQIEIWGSGFTGTVDNISVRELPGNHAYNPSGNSANFPVLQQDGTGRYYLAFNGVNQWLQTNSIDFTYGDKMFVAAGVRKLSDAATGMLTELSVNLNANAGSFYVLAPNTIGANTYAFVANGTAQASTIGTGYGAPITNVFAAVGNISGPNAVMRVNGTQVAQSTASQGTGNYGNYPLYIGARAGSSLFFNGRLYGLIVAGKSASASEIASTEAWLNQKTGAY